MEQLNNDTIIELNAEDYIRYAKYFKFEIENEHFIIDKSGVKTVEMLGASLYFNPMNKYISVKGRKTPKKYIQKELDWYDSQSLDVTEIGKTAKIWLDVSSKDNKINSNYGYLIYSDENFNQYENCKKALIENASTRRAIMIYTRPSMQVEYNKDGMSDFICTNYHHFFIRKGKLHSIVSQRSSDAIFGLMNDYPWFAEVQQRLLKDLQEFYPELEMGFLQMNMDSLHVYERHFDLIQKIVKLNS